MMPGQPSQPDQFLSQMEHLLGNEFPAFQTSLERPLTTGLRVNSLKLSPQEFLALLHGFELEQVPWCPTGFRLVRSGQTGKHPYLAAGLYYLQEPSAMAAVELLAPRPGEHVLDLSAAPGGKATHLVALMQNEGLLVANEIHPQRVWELAENLERWGARNTVITNETPLRLAEHFGAFFDRVLVDAPCSGEGMFRKSAAARRDWSPELVQGCAIRQQEILEQAARLVKPGGWLAYSTCTFNIVENEMVIAKFNQQHPDFELVEPKQTTGFSPGRPDWVTHELRLPELQRTVRLWPHIAPAEGHFIALLQRISEHTGRGGHTGPPLRAFHSRRNRIELPAPAWRSFEVFSRSALKPGSVDFHANHHLKQVGSYLYAQPLDLPDLGDLKTIHPGWWLGTFKKDRFVPSHALALGLPTRSIFAADLANQRLDYAAHSREASTYLRGESLPSPGQDGWVLITVDGFPLGWSKRVNGILKNYYPKGLRRFE